MRHARRAGGVANPESGRSDLRRKRLAAPRDAWRTIDTDVDYDTRGLPRLSVHPDDPGSAGQDIAATTTMGRPGWRVRTGVYTRIVCTADAFIVQARLQAFDGDQAVFSRSWNETIAGDAV